MGALIKRLCLTKRSHAMTIETAIEGILALVCFTFVGALCALCFV